MKEYQQIDSKLIENLFKLLDPVWLEGEINKPVSLLLTSEVERLESKIANLMDFKHSPEYSQKLEVFISFIINFFFGVKVFFHKFFKNSYINITWSTFLLF